MLAAPLPTPHPRLPTACWLELLSCYGSPLYVYDGDRLRDTIQQISQAVAYPATHCYFASVTNGNVALLKIFQQQGWGLHANTPGDVYLGLQAGFPPSRIVYSGSNLSRDDLEQLFTWGVKTFNLDSVSQVEWLGQTLHAAGPVAKPESLQLGLRLNCKALTGDSRIGVRPEEFTIATRLAHQAGFTLSGLHFYRGTGTNATKAFTQVIDQVIAIAQQLPDWHYLDFGGGFGYPYHPDGVAFDWQDFGQQLGDRLQQLSRPIQLMIEPGRAAIAACGTLLCQVVSVKWQDGKQIVGTNTTVGNLSVPSVHGGYREIAVVQTGDRRQETEAQVTPHPHPLFPTDVCGNTTYSRDYLGRHCSLPALHPGDVLAVLDVGAYGYAMSSHFLHRPRPAEVLVENGTHRLIRQREDYSVLLMNQVL